MTYTCKECWHHRSDLGDSKDYCTRFPPTVFFVPGAGAFGPQTISTYPPINVMVPCGEFRQKIAKPQLAEFPSEGGERPCDVEP